MCRHNSRFYLIATKSATTRRKRSSPDVAAVTRRVRVVYRESVRARMKVLLLP